MLGCSLRFQPCRKERGDDRPLDEQIATLQKRPHFADVRLLGEQPLSTRIELCEDIGWASAETDSPCSLRALIHDSEERILISGDRLKVGAVCVLAPARRAHRLEQKPRFATHPTQFIDEGDDACDGHLVAGRELVVHGQAARRENLVALPQLIRVRRALSTSC
jgi:hypothetical protein